MPNRERRELPTLDKLIAEDDSVRLFEEVLSQVDWTPWGAKYKPGNRGQPPIHLRLYGLYRGIRSSRRVADACVYRFDFMWLVHGMRIDFSTNAKFRTRFHEPLKDLFRQIGHLAMNLGFVRLCEVSFDGTRVKANNGRFRTQTAASLEEKLRAFDELYEQLLSDRETTVASDASCYYFHKPRATLLLALSLSRLVEGRGGAVAALTALLLDKSPSDTRVASAASAARSARRCQMRRAPGAFSHRSPFAPSRGKPFWLAVVRRACRIGTCGRRPTSQAANASRATRLLPLPPLPPHLRYPEPRTWALPDDLHSAADTTRVSLLLSLPLRGRARMEAVTMLSV